MGTAATSLISLASAAPGRAVATLHPIVTVAPSRRQNRRYRDVFPRERFDSGFARFGNFANVREALLTAARVTLRPEPRNSEDNSFRIPIFSYFLNRRTVALMPFWRSESPKIGEPEYLTGRMANRIPP